MKEFLLKLSIAVATAIVLGILAKTWDLIPNPANFRIPKGTIAAFALTEPPDGWEIYEPARGRFIIGVGSTPDGAAYALEEKGGTDAHKLFPDTFQLVFAQLSGVGGSPYIRPNAKLNMTGLGSFDGRPPFISLLICRKK